MNRFTALFVTACLMSGAFWTSIASASVSAPFTAFGIAVRLNPKLGEMYQHNMSILLGKGSSPMDDEVKKP